MTISLSTQDIGLGVAIILVILGYCLCIHKSPNLTSSNTPKQAIDMYDKDDNNPLPAVLPKSYTIGVQMRSQDVYISAYERYDNTSTPVVTTSVNMYITDVKGNREVLLHFPNTPGSIVTLDTMVDKLQKMRKILVDNQGLVSSKSTGIAPIRDEDEDSPDHPFAI